MKALRSIRIVGIVVDESLKLSNMELAEFIFRGLIDDCDAVFLGR
ncbi:putative uncharacterized protein [Corynebacterium casei UCMA 3821]|uniref:Uncharacterized protein n=1 Tax=Corynebacterium casei UCMA 3821 TaxID=1110505 RepID=G7HXG6_9CORY|nr:putative uncharacterized protein [Corynebacterium casei UCMA 3821]